jgi:hypothetical protein
MADFRETSLQNVLCIKGFLSPCVLDVPACSIYIVDQLVEHIKGGKRMTPEQTAIHNAAIEEAAQALEALKSKNIDVPEEYFTGFDKAKILGAAAIRALKA